MGYGFRRPGIVKQGTVTPTGTPTQGTLAASSSLLAFVSNAGAGIVTATTDISNAGPGSLRGPKVGTVSGTLASALSVQFLAGYQLLITLDPAGLAIGTYSATVPITDANASNTPLNLTVTADITLSQPKPTLAVDAALPYKVIGAEGQNAAPFTFNVFNATGPLSAFTNLRITSIVGAWLQPTLNAQTGVVTVTFDTSALAAGNYGDASFSLTADNATNPNLFVGFILSVVANPAQLVLSTNALGFSCIQSGPAPADQTVTITNGGGGTLGTVGVGTITYQQGSGWANGSGVSGGVLTVRVSQTGLVAGAYNCTIPVTASAASNSPQSVQVTLIVLPTVQPGIIQLTPSSVTFSGTAGTGTVSPTSSAVLVTDAGGGGLGNLSLGSPVYLGGPGGQTWADGVTLSGNSVTVTAVTGNLSAGTYSCTIDVFASLASNSPQKINVSFTVAAAPPAQLALTPNSLAFTAQVGGSNPSSKTVAVSNAGGGSLGTVGVGAITYAQGSGWASAVYSAGVVTVTLTTGALAAGTFNCSIPITSSTATNSPQSIAVAFTLSTGPVLLPLFNLPVGMALNASGFPTGSPNNMTLARPTFSGTKHGPYTTVAELQNKIDGIGGLAEGDEILIDVTAFQALAGAVITLPRRTNPTGWVCIRPDDTNYNTLNAAKPYTDNYLVATAAANRIDPTTDRANLAPILSNQTNIPCIRFANASEGWWLTGLELGPKGTTVIQDSAVKIRPATGLNLWANYPRRITFERCEIHGQLSALAGLSRAFWVEGESLLFAHNYMHRIVELNTSDAQCMLAITGPKYLLAFNNHFDAAAENHLFGGGTIQVTNMNGSDCAFIRNEYTRNTSYPAGRIKNYWELKVGERIFSFGNVLHGLVQTANSGQVNAQLYQCVDQLAGSPWVKIENVIEIANFYHTTTTALTWNLLSAGIGQNPANPGQAQVNPTQGLRRMQFMHCAWLNITAIPGLSATKLRIAGHGISPGITDNVDDIQFDHVHVEQGNSWMFFDQAQNRMLNFKFRNSSFNDAAAFGPVFRDLGQTNATALNTAAGAGNWEVARNVGITSGAAPLGTLANAPYFNKYDTAANIFTNPVAGSTTFADWVIKAGSVYKGSATDGTDPGPDWTYLAAAIAGVV